MKHNRVASIALAVVLLGASTAQAIKLPGAAVLENSEALRQNVVAIGRYPQVTAHFPASLVQRAAIASIPVYLPRVLPASAPTYARVTAAPGVHRVELTFTADCDAAAHFCHYATLLSQTVITPPSDARPVTYKGVAMQYHAPICFAYCNDGGLYFQLGGVWHAIEARGQLSVLEKIYDTYALVQ
jgi:hypothetical protein